MALGRGRLPAAGRSRDEGGDGDGTGPDGSRAALPEGSGKPGGALGGADAVCGRPAIPMDNNTSERLAHGPAVARKNFYGSGSLWSGQLAAAVFSILSRCRCGGINPRKWLTCYFERCAAAGARSRRTSNYSCRGT